jgi:hypothetical protein
MQFVIIPFLLIAPTAAALASDGDSVLCVERAGGIGRLNITPVTVTIDYETELTILGEEQMCLRSPREGPVRLQLRFRYPYYGAREKLRWWRTEPMSVTLSRGSTTKVMLCPREQDRNGKSWAQNGWHRLWVLSPPESPKACGLLYAK